MYIRFIIRLLRTVGTSSARIYYRTAKYRVGKILFSRDANSPAIFIPRGFGESGIVTTYIPTFAAYLNILFATNIDLQVRIDIS